MIPMKFALATTLCEAFANMCIGGAREFVPFLVIISKDFWYFLKV